MAQGDSRIPLLLRLLDSNPALFAGMVLWSPSGKRAPGAYLASFETRLTFCEVCDQSWKNNPWLFHQFSPTPGQWLRFCGQRVSPCLKALTTITVVHHIHLPRMIASYLRNQGIWGEGLRIWWGGEAGSVAWTPWRGVQGKPKRPESDLVSLLCLNSF